MLSPNVLRKIFTNEPDPSTQVAQVSKALAQFWNEAQDAIIPSLKSIQNSFFPKKKKYIYISLVLIKAQIKTISYKWDDDAST